MLVPHFCLLQNHQGLLFFPQFLQRSCLRCYLSYLINFYSLLLVLDSSHWGLIPPGRRNNPIIIINFHRIISRIPLSRYILLISPDRHFISFNLDCILLCFNHTLGLHHHLNIRLHILNYSFRFFCRKN